ncbi:hypothetical protein RI367_007127 [Sorochytrium milnesiophthora]
MSFLDGDNSENREAWSMWLACYIHMLVWMLMLVAYWLADGVAERRTARHHSTFVRSSTAMPTPSAAATEDGSATRPLLGRDSTAGMSGVIPTEAYLDKHFTWVARFKRAVRAARLNFLLIFTATVVTVLGYGTTPATVVLVWVGFGLGAIWTVAELFMNSAWMREIMGWMVFVSTGIVWGMAFRSRVD